MDGKKINFKAPFWSIVLPVILILAGWFALGYYCITVGLDNYEAEREAVMMEYWKIDNGVDK